MDCSIFNISPRSRSPRRRHHNSLVTVDKDVKKVNKSTNKVIPRPDKKKFLSSVLTILSQTTTGVQCDVPTERKRKPPKRKVNNINEHDNKRKTSPERRNRNSNKDYGFDKDKDYLNHDSIFFPQEKTVVNQNADENEKKLLKQIDTTKSDKTIPENNNLKLIHDNREQMDNQLYNFCVGLLASLDNYSKVDQNKPIPTKSIKTHNEDDDDDVYPKLKSTVYPRPRCKDEICYEDHRDSSIDDFRRKQVSNTKIKRKRKAKICPPREKTSKSFLKLLKRELERDWDEVDGPENFYNALKNIAKTKRISNSVYFKDENSIFNNDFDNMKTARHTVSARYVGFNRKKGNTSKLNGRPLQVFPASEDNTKSNSFNDTRIDRICDDLMWN